MFRGLSRPTLIVLTIFAAIFSGLVVPVRSASYQLHPIILVDGNSAFTLANGVTSGTGTRTNPYIIEGWNITHPADSASNFYAIWIRNTNAYFTIRNDYLCGGGLNRVGVTFDNVTNGQVQTAHIPNCARSTIGISIAHSHNVTIYNNLCTSENLILSNSFNVTVSANTFVPCSDYINPNNAPIIVSVYHSNRSTFTTNNFFGGSLGLTFSRGILVYGNNFLNMCDICKRVSVGVDNQGNLNSWDNGYPAGGNYWVNYIAADQCSGPNQDVCKGPDGIADRPYHFQNATDKYSLMKAYADQAPPSWTSSKTLTAQNIGQTSLGLQWGGGSDDLGVTGYRIYGNGMFLASVGRLKSGVVQTNILITGLDPGTTYTFYVVAVNVANTTSVDGPSLNVNTLPLWWQITSPAWWRLNWYWGIAVITYIASASFITAFYWRRGKRQKKLTEFA